MTRSRSAAFVAAACMLAACAPVASEQAEEQVAVAREAITGTEDQPNSCSPTPHSFYRLPFGPQSTLSLVQGNWDDPNPSARHVQADGQAQSYSYDFSAPVGTEVRAARAGRVAFVHSIQSANLNDGISDAHLPLNLRRGEGNLVVIRHVDDTAAAYAHLQMNQVLVREGEYVPRGRVIALSGNTGSSDFPHLHFDVHPSFTDWDHWEPTMKIKFQDAAHTCWRPQVGNALDSNNTVTGTNFYALMGPGGGTQSFLAGMEVDDFLAAWIDLGTSAPFQEMKDFDSYLENGVRRFVGVFGPGPGGQGFHTHLTYQELVDLRVELANPPTNQEMITFDTYMDGSTRRYNALFGQRTAGQDFEGNLTYTQFLAKIDAQENLGRALLTFHVYPSGGQMRYVGLFGPGQLGQQFVSEKTFQEFWDLWIAVGQQTPHLDMKAFRVYQKDGQTRYAGVFGPGQLGQSFYPNKAYDVMASDWEETQAASGGLVSAVALSE